VKLTWHRLRPGAYRSADGAWLVRRASEDGLTGDWLLFGPDPETGTEIWYGDYPTKTDAQEGAYL
jgi:hypothetical protein